MLKKINKWNIKIFSLWKSNSSFSTSKLKIFILNCIIKLSNYWELTIEMPVNLSIMCNWLPYTQLQIVLSELGCKGQNFKALYHAVSTGKIHTQLALTHTSS